MRRHIWPVLGAVLSLVVAMSCGRRDVDLLETVPATTLMVATGDARLLADSLKLPADLGKVMEVTRCVMFPLPAGGWVATFPMIMNERQAEEPLTRMFGRHVRYEGYWAYGTSQQRSAYVNGSQGWVVLGTQMSPREFGAFIKGARRAPVSRDSLWMRHLGHPSILGTIHFVARAERLLPWLKARSIITGRLDATGLTALLLDSRGRPTDVLPGVQDVDSAWVSPGAVGALSVKGADWHRIFDVLSPKLPFGARMFRRSILDAFSHVQAICVVPSCGPLLVLYLEMDSPEVARQYVGLAAQLMAAINDTWSARCQDNHIIFSIPRPWWLQNNFVCSPERTDDLLGWYCQPGIAITLTQTRMDMTFRHVPEALEGSVVYSCCGGR